MSKQKTYVNGALVKQYRTRLHMIQQDLADQAGWGLRAIQDLETTNEATLRIIEDVATALGRTYDELTALTAVMGKPLLSTADVIPGSYSEPENAVTVEITLSTPLDQFTQADQVITLFRAMVALLSPQTNMAVTAVRRGSINVTFRIDDELLFPLIKSFGSGALSEQAPELYLYKLLAPFTSELELGFGEWFATRLNRLQKNVECYINNDTMWGAYVVFPELKEVDGTRAIELILFPMDSELLNQLCEPHYLDAIRQSSDMDLPTRWETVWKPILSLHLPSRD